jgi:hypothetical protein
VPPESRRRSCPACYARPQPLKGVGGKACVTADIACQAVLTANYFVTGARWLRTPDRRIGAFKGELTCRRILMQIIRLGICESVSQFLIIAGGEVLLELALIVHMVLFIRVFRYEFFYAFCVRGCDLAIDG